MTIITSLLLPRLRVQTWTLLSLVLLLISMAIAYAGQYVETENFVYLQVSPFLGDCLRFFKIICGSLNGSGAGIGYCLCIIVPQAWFDKTRTQMNGYLLIGAPIGTLLTSYFWPILANYYTWSGALLIIIGLQEIHKNRKLIKIKNLGNLYEIQSVNHLSFGQYSKHIQNHQSNLNHFGFIIPN